LHNNLQNMNSGTFLTLSEVARHENFVHLFNVQYLFVCREHKSQKTKTAIPELLLVSKTIALQFTISLSIHINFPGVHQNVVILQEMLRSTVWILMEHFEWEHDTMMTS